MDRQRQPELPRRRARRRVQKLIETLQVGSESALIFKVPSIFEGQYIYFLQFGGRDYYFPTQHEAHKALREIARHPPRRKAA
jgi:Mor family transcriptional regulator